MVLPKPLPKEPPPTVRANDDQDQEPANVMSEDQWKAVCGTQPNSKRELQVSICRGCHENDTTPHDVGYAVRRDVGSNPASASASNATETVPSVTALGTTVSGAALVEMGSQLYWSYTFALPTACDFPTSSLTISTVTATATLSDQKITSGTSASTSASDPPCTYSDDAHDTSAGACVCTNDVTLSVSMSNGQPCPWTSLPAAAYAAQAALTGDGQAARRDATAAAGVPTTLVTQTAEA